MIVPISVGSITDVAARLTAQELQERARPIGHRHQQSRAPPWCSAAANAPNRIPTATRCAWSAPTPCRFTRLTIPNLPYNPEKDFTPVIDMYHVVEGLMTPAASGINSIDELRAKAVAEPGKLNYGTLGERTTTRRVPAMARRALADEFSSPSPTRR